MPHKKSSRLSGLMQDARGGDFTSRAALGMEDPMAQALANVRMRKMMQMRQAQGGQMQPMQDTPTGGVAPPQSSLPPEVLMMLLQQQRGGR
jgi:hypothetical protein